MSVCALDDPDAYIDDAGDSIQMTKRCRTDIALVEDSASRKKLQNRIAQRAYRKRLKSRMEELESFRDTMTGGKMTLVVGASPGTDQDESNKQTVSNQLSIPTFGAPMLGGTIESKRSVSYFESRDNTVKISRTGLPTPSTIVDTSYNADQDMPALGSWDLGEAYPVALSLNGIGPANGRHASPQFCSRPIEEPSSHATSDVPQDGKTALHVAAESGRLSTVQLLLRLQSNVLAQDSVGRTSLHLAVGNQQQSVVEELVKRPACLDVQEKDGRTALHIAVTQGHEGIVTSLLGAGAMLEVKDARGQTPLHIAAATGQDAVLQLLFVRGANINATM